jgi:hypothetical protein
MNGFVVLLAGLAVPGLLPALAVAGRSPVVVFLAPLTGALLAAVAALIEFAVAGSLAADYAVVAVIANLAVIAWWLTARRSARAPARQVWRWGWGWSVATVVVVLAAVAFPLNDLRVPAIGGDPNTIWLTHALLAYGGHHTYLAGLRSPAYQFSNPDYPPLVPGVEALGFSFFGLSDLHLGVDLTLLLTACALGAAGAGIAAAGSTGRRPARVTGIAAAGAICLVGFAVSGVDAADGYTDLLWAAAAVAAVLWGLVLPQGARQLGVAWICAAVASLTKNEGLTTALVILVLIALRYRPLTMRGQAVRRWAERAAFVVVPALPGVAWAGLIYLLGVRDNFFASSSGQSRWLRAGVSVQGISAHLRVVGPVAICVLLVGCLILRRDRRRSRLGNPAWLWLVLFGSLTILLITYVIGAIEIHLWMANSTSRTTTFAQVLLYAEIAVWLVIAADGLLAPADDRPPGREGAAKEAADPVPQGASNTPSRNE